MSDQRNQAPAPGKHEAPGGSRHWWLWASGVVALVVVGVGGGLIGAAIASPNSSSNASSTGNAAATTTSACQVTSVANEVLPSVVTISARGSGGGGAGSGEVIRSDGYILTNNHVISIAANGGSVEVLYSDGTSAPAMIVGRDVMTDLAVIKTDTAPKLPV